MTTAITSSASSDILQQLLRLSAAGQASATGQVSPGDGAAEAAAPAGAAPTPPPGPPPAKASSASDSFSSDTLSALVASQAQSDAAATPGAATTPAAGGDGSNGLQQAHHGHGHHHHGGAPPADSSDPTSTASDIAASIIGAADTSGTGALSLDDFTKALSPGGSGAGSAPGDVGQAFASLDGDGDGRISQGELTSAIQSFLNAQANVGGHAGQPPNGASVSLAA